MENNIIVLLIVLAIKQKDNPKIQVISDFLNGLTVDSPYTEEKLKILRKIGPYFPEQYISHINKAILISQTYMVINDLHAIFHYGDYDYIQESIPLKNDRDRFNKIVNLLQEGNPSLEKQKLGLVMNLLVNMDQYKAMFTTFNSLISNHKSGQSPYDLISSLAPILGVDPSKDPSKLKEFANVFEIIDLLNSPDKEEKSKK